MANNTRNAGRKPFYPKEVKTEIYRILIRTDKKQEMIKDFEEVKQKFKNQPKTN